MNAIDKNYQRASAIDILRPVDAAAQLAPILAQRASQLDRDGQFSLQNIEDLHRYGLLSLAVPSDFGGADASFAEVIDVIGLIASGDPSTALVLLMQTLHHRSILVNNTWPQAVREEVFGKAITEGALINALRVEPEQGSPVRGGRPATVAVRERDGWRISGHKLYSTGSPGLTWGIVWASTEASDGRIGEFLVPLKAEGVRIEPTWDHLGLRASGSHDVILENVFIPADYAVDLRTPEEWARQDIGLNAWLPIMLSALYDGVARSARDWLLPWINRRKPSNLGTSLAEVPRFRSAVGEIEAWLQINAQLLDAAKRELSGVSVKPGRPQALVLNPSLIKYSVTQNAIAVVERALSLIGNHGLTRNNPLERHYRDVLCSRVHQPQNDLILEGAGRIALERAVPASSI